MKKIFGALLFILSAVAIAAAVTFNWSNPTANTDGTVFNPATDQLNTRIYCDQDINAFVPESPNLPQLYLSFARAQGAATSTTEANDSGAVRCFGTVTSNDGWESMPSNLIRDTPSIPNPPVLSENAL